MMEVEMKIRGLMMDPVTNMPIVILKGVADSAILPIWVGIYEANAIALEIEKVQTPRPMTHDLVRNVLLGVNATVKKVVVTELKDDTFYALIWLERNGTTISIDSRPSDALALALRTDAPIFVDDSVLKSSPRFSSQRRNSSLPTLSETALATLDDFRTLSSTKIGASVRKASARASPGRESMEMVVPFRSNQIKA